MANKFDDYDESKSNLTAYKGTAGDDNVTNQDIDFSGLWIYTFEGNDTVTIEAPSANFITIYDGLGNDSYTVTVPASYDYNLYQDHIVELDFKGPKGSISLKFAPHEFDGSLHTLDVDMTLGEAIYKTATIESIDTFGGISKIDITAFTSFYSRLKVSLKGNNENNIFKIQDGTKATIDGNGGTDVIDIVAGSDLVVDLRDQSGTEGTFKNIEGIVITTKYGPGNITLIGDEKDNIFKSGDGDDTVYGYGGNDFIYVDSGNDVIDGGTGVDTAIYKDSSSAYTLTANDDDTFSVVHSSPSEGLADEGTDTLTSIEKMQFSDKTLSKTSLKYQLSETLDSSQNSLSAHTEDILSGTLNFNKGDNIIILDGQGKTYRGLEGDDTYFVSQLLPKNGKVSITDTEGSNLVQLPANTYIDNSLFTKNAARLTLEDGREITISGADKFSYNVGGNITDGTQGTDLTFTEFAEVFGVYDILNSSGAQTGEISDMYII